MIRVGYVSGRTLEAAPEDWPGLPSEGVDFVEFTNEAGMVGVSGHSLYWLYRERESWVVGGGTVGSRNPLGETVVGKGDHRYREIDFMPDLSIGAVKLGAWWPGKERHG